MLKCDFHTGDCEWLQTIKAHQKTHEPVVGALRGGSAAKVFNGRTLVGFGHATLSSMQHSPFLFTIDMETFDLELSFMKSTMRVTPFDGFLYMDPTSFWQQEEDYDAIEEEGDSSHLGASQKGAKPDTSNAMRRKRIVRTYVICTLRAAPDYLSFDQSHHQTVIFQAESKLLRILAEEP